jgi:hypothetical protein
MLALSAAYNMWPVSPAKWVLRRFDHSAIYLLIAGTYTPFLAQMKNVLASAGLASRALAYLQLVSRSPTWQALGQVVLVYFAVGSAAVTAQDTRPGRATFAEVIAFARLASVPCQRLAPDADSFHALALRRLIQPPITEEEIAAKEKDIRREASHRINRSRKTTDESPAGLRGWACRTRTQESVRGRCI